MQAKLNILTAASGEAFERDFMGEGEIIVRREGHSRARHVFLVNGRIIGRLRWRGMRRAVYEAEGMSFHIKVGALDKSICITSEDGSESFLIERSRANPHRAGMRAQMAEGDDLRVVRSCSSRFKLETSFLINKPFYHSTLMAFYFDTGRRTQTTVRIQVEPAMKWEARFIHRLLALVVCRIILERRHAGSQPLRVKEKSRCFSDSGRGRGALR